MHIALGVSNEGFPLNQFLRSLGKAMVTIKTRERLTGDNAGTLVFSSNRTRRGGEWLIRDQFSHRHPAWTASSGFPTKYDHRNPPYVLVIRVGTCFYAAFSTLKKLSRLARSTIPEGLLSGAKGIRPVSAEFLAGLHIPTQNLLSALTESMQRLSTEPFDPKNIQDGRHRIMAAVIRRLGQQSFRRKLLQAYTGRCAISHCDTLWVLEAAHITPYLGLKTNAISNGLLLRADIHTLFDLALISIEPNCMKIRVSSALANSLYVQLDGRRPRLPNRRSVQPSIAALEQHFRTFQP